MVAKRVQHIMRCDFVSADPDEPLEGARQTMRMARLRHLLVMRNGRLLGILSYRDLLESLLANGGESPQVRVGDTMKPSPACVTPETSLSEAADRLCRYGLGCLPVLEPVAGAADAIRVIAVVTERDLLRAAYHLSAS